MYPQHTDFSQPTPNLPKTNPQSTSSNNGRNSSPQSSLPCGQRTPAASTSSSDAPSSQTPPHTFTTSHQPQFPTRTQNTSPGPHKQHTPSKTNIDQFSQSSIAGEDQQCVPKSADGTGVKRSKQQPRQPDERLCFHCNLPGHLKRNCPKIPYCSKCRTKGHTRNNMHLVLHAHLLILVRNHLPHIVNLHFMYRHPLSTQMLPHFHLICTKHLYCHMHKVDPIIFILIHNKLTHHHILLAHNFHHLLILMSHHHISHNTWQLLVHLHTVVILQSYWLYKSNGNAKKN